MPNFNRYDQLKALNPIEWLRKMLKLLGLEWFCKRFYGTYDAIVIDNADPEERGRIRVMCPAIGMITEDAVPPNYWARPCLPGLGADPTTGQVSGVWWVPDVGSLAYVQFIAGDPEHPIWVGGSIPESKQMPEFTSAAMLRKGLRTRAGHYLRFSDEADDLHIMLAKGDGSGGQAASFFTLDKDGNVLISNDNGSLFYMNNANSAITLIAANADGETEAMVNLGADQVLLSTKSSGTVEIKGDAITLNGGTVTVNASKFLLNSQAIYLGKGAAEPAVLGNKLMIHTSTHIHPTSAPGAPTAPPAPPPLLLGQQLSQVVFIK
jgi:uncharacterized protein involved in type VI secretion and phage assembly